jgi:hypothetical protein
MSYSNTEHFYNQVGREKFAIFSVLQGCTKVEWGLEHQKAIDDL